MVITDRWAGCTKLTAIKPEVQTVSKQQAAHAKHRSYSIDAAWVLLEYEQNREGEAKALLTGCEHKIILWLMMWK